MSHHVTRIAAAMAVALCASLAQAAPTVGVFTGSAPGQGLDLQGDFTYALTMNPGAAGVTLGDATFTNAFTTAGVGLGYANYIGNWYPAGYEPGTLGAVMQSIIWTPANGAADSQVVTLSLSNLQVGQTYKVQLLFAEACCARGFDIYQDGVKQADDVSPYALTGGVAYNPNQSAVFSNTFVATASTVVFGLGGQAAYGDNNPILNAATLESIPSAVPEASAYGMTLAGLLVVGALVQRRRRAL